MIARLRGRVVVSDTDHVVLEASGVGYQVQCHLRTLAALHEMGDREVTLHVHTSVTDDAIRLYGFLGRDELRLFRLLIGVERIGPKAALSILGRAELPAMVRAIRDGDVALLATVPGIGRRTAERVILELRDRLAEVALSLEPAAPTAAAQAIEAAVAGLVGLGFRESEARPAVRAALAGAGEADGDVTALVGRALRLLDVAPAK
ncbi:MAG: Holliday junction branch migration protein RuvA [Candidatus Dormibacteria bacterium]